MCGILGIYNNIEFDNIKIKELLEKIQHRGQESYGISYTVNDNINNLKFNGKIKDLPDFKSNSIIAHTRYSTSGKSKKNDLNKKDNFNDEIQPFLGNHKELGDFSLVHNGNIPYNSYNENIKKFVINETNYYNYFLKKNENIEFLSDTHMILKFIESFDFNYFKNNIDIDRDSKWTLILKQILNIFKKAYCFIVLTNDNMYIMRDKYSVRPLSIGFNESGWCVASESIVFDNNYNFMRNIKQGEILSLNKNGVKTLFLYKNNDNTQISANCLFEYIYFLKENTYSDGFHVSELRYHFGLELANQDIIENNIITNAIVVGTPSTGIPSGKGYADQTNLPYIQVLKKDVNLGRTFILENNKKRDNACKKKYYLDIDKIKNKKIIIVDDSLVRGTTIKNLIRMFKENGAQEVHVRIAAPPIKHACYYGIDIPNKEELIANNLTIEQIKNIIEADSLNYLSLNDIKKIMKDKFNNLCTGCFNNNYNDIDW